MKSLKNLSALTLAAALVTTPLAATTSTTTSEKPVAVGVVAQGELVSTAKAAKKIKGRAVVAPGRPTIVDKPGHKSDRVVAPKNTKSVKYHLSHLRTKGTWTLTATAQKGYIFPNGSLTATSKGRVNVTTPKKAPVKKINGNIVVTAAKPTIVDKPGYKNDRVIAPKNTATITYYLMYFQKEGVWDLTATAKKGYVFSNGKNYQITSGTLSTREQQADPITSTFTSCRDMVSRWKPAHLPKGVTVRCENNPQSTVNGKRVGVMGYALAYVQPDNTYRSADLIVIKNNMPSEDLADTFTHEAWHVASFNWSPTKQKAFWKHLGAKDWYGNKDYIHQPVERWAWAATACSKPASNSSAGKFYESLLPRGCADVTYWHNLKM